MEKEALAIATICWARDEEEEQLLRTSLTELSLLEIPVFVTDGGSKGEFVDFIKSLHNFHVFSTETKGLWAQAHQSLLSAAASGASFILYTEPDKLDFFREVPSILNKVKINEQTGIVLMSRSTDSFSTFPAFQQMTETTINSCCKEVMGKLCDYTYGPFILKGNIVNYIKDLPSDIGWGWRPFTFNIASRLGYFINIYTGNFKCPATQREDDKSERLYRMKQLVENIKGLTLSHTITLPIEPI